MPETSAPPPAGPVLLINPPWITRDQNIWHGIKGAMPPLGLLSIGAVLERAGLEVHILDAHLEAMSEAEVLAAIAAARPRVVGITMMTSTALVSHRIAQLAKQVDPDILVVVGGVHPDALPEETLRNRCIDVVVRGDGEFTMLELSQGQPLDEVAGISFRQEGRPRHNPDRPVLLDLGSLPPYAYHLVPMGRYYPAVGAYRKLPAINMLMTRGCPGKCIFCNSAETTLRSRPAAMVVSEIEHLRDTYGVREIQFYDDTFTVEKRNALEFCRLMEERRVGVGFTCFARADCFSERMAVALRQAGCHQVMFGLESGSPRILRNLRKDIDLERTHEAVRLAKREGLEVRAAFVFGTPGETLETLEETMAFTLDLDPDLAIFNIMTPYPGTQLYQWALDRGLLTSDDWWEYELGNPLVELGTISAADLVAAYRGAFRRFYNRPRMYWRRLVKIRSLRHLWDSLDAFLHIMGRAKLTGRGRYVADWLRHRRGDFHDLEFATQDRTVPVPRVLEALPVRV